jgi:uncharacterized protein (DUF2236 family)
MQPTQPASIPPPQQAPLGPGSLTWRYFGDIRGLLCANRAGLLQVMHPAISAGLLDHSTVLDNPWARNMRSVSPIMGTVYDDAPDVTAQRVRDYHRTIKGNDARGRAYHALQPETYFWAHATFVDGQIATQELFGEALTRAAKEQLYRESITWYGRYGMSMAPVPRDYAAFEAYFAHMLEHVVEATPFARTALESATWMVPSPHARLPEPLWRMMRPFLIDCTMFLFRTTLPEPVREKLGLTPTAADRRRLRRFARAVQLIWSVLPRRLRYLPRAYRALERQPAARALPRPPQPGDLR